MDHHARAASLTRAILSLGDASLRARYVASTACEAPIDAVASALDVICQRAEQGEAAAREALVAVVDALNGADMQEIVRRLREQAAGESLLALERLIRHPSQASAAAPPRLVGSGPSPGHMLTLGERKWLARRPDRDTIQRLLTDPHPDVVARCLSNPRTTEDDVVRLAARRPGRGDVLTEVARSRWVRRPRVRLALAMNPATPVEVAARVTGLLLRPELELVARSPGVRPPVRAVCLEHLERRPPAPAKRGDDRLQ